ncbi:tropomyosin-1, isoforms 33/34-like [Cydia amplana]|uniref:tropomyosin-1, isoforms 33/34-like n=1 Tax=Cydia amplana TaxID=1869771 RepID=UPI002FE680EF
MTTRTDVLVAKMQQLQKELKIANDLNKRLLQEQEESEQQFECVVRTNTTLKTQLANQDVEFEDMQGQWDELQAAVDQFKTCQEIHEQALQRIQDLEQQLEESESKHTCKYCSGHSGPPDNNLSIFAELNSFDVDIVYDNIECSPMVETVNSKSSVHIEGSNDIRVTLKGSKKIKKYLKLSRFIKKSKLLLKRHNSMFKTIQSKCKGVALSADLLNCQHQLDRTVEELNHRSDELRKLELKLISLNNRDELSSKALQEYIAFMNNVLEPGSGYHLRMDSPRPPTRPAAPESPALRAVLAAPGSPALRALFASRASLVSELRSDSEPAPSRVDSAPPLPTSPPCLVEQVPSWPGFAEPVPSLPGLVEPAPSPPSLVEPAPSPPSLVQLALSLLTYVEPAPPPPRLPSPAPSPQSLVELASSPPRLVELAPSPPRPDELAPSLAPSPPRLVELAPSPPRLVELAPSPPRLVELAPSPPRLVELAPSPPRLVELAPSPPRPRIPARTALYSDEGGAGLGALLAERLSRGVINNCHPGASVDRLVECIAAGEFDRDSTLEILQSRRVIDISET